MWSRWPALDDLAVESRFVHEEESELIARTEVAPASDPY
jgi:hypothetical protein